MHRLARGGRIVPMGTEDVIRAYIQVVRDGDRPAAFALLADDVVGHVPGRSVLAGVKHGRAAVEAYIRDMVERATEGLSVEVLDVLIGAEHAALMVVERLAPPERTAEIRRMNTYRVRDGRITEIRIFEADQYAVDEFTAAEFGPAGQPAG